MFPLQDKGGETGSGKQHTIKHDALGNTTVSDLTLVEVATWKEVELMMQKAAQSR
jgi:kinesin family protein C1